MMLACLAIASQAAGSTSFACSPQINSCISSAARRIADVVVAAPDVPDPLSAATGGLKPPTGGSSALHAFARGKAATRQSRSATDQATPAAAAANSAACRWHPRASDCRDGASGGRARQETSAPSSTPAASPRWHDIPARRRNLALSMAALVASVHPGNISYLSLLNVILGYTGVAEDGCARPNEQWQYRPAGSRPNTGEIALAAG